MIVVAIAFIVSWTPFYVITFISQVQQRSFLKESNFLFTMLLIHWFGFLHSCINPIIYNFMNEKFHRNFKQILHRCLIQRHSFRKNSTLLFGSSSKSSKSNSLENSPCMRGRQRQQQQRIGGREKGIPNVITYNEHHRNSLENSPCIRGRQRQQQQRIGGREKGIPDVITYNRVM